MDHHGDICSDAASGSSYDWNILMSDNVTKLKPCALGFSLGLWWGIAMLLLAWCGWWFGWGLAFTKVIGSAYLGMAPTFLGGIFGLIWGFVDFFIFGVLIALVYNCCVKCCAKKCGDKSSCDKPPMQ